MTMANKVDFNKRFYNEHWRHSWKARFMYDPISKRDIVKHVLKNVGYKDGGKSVLDIGFGFGLILLSFDRNNYICGIELAESAVSFAEVEVKRRGFENYSFHVYKGSGLIDLASDAFDLIICSHVLEHVPDDDFLLDEIRRMLKPEGMAFLNIPINEEHFLDPRHMRKYTPAAFLKQVERHGFTVVLLYQGDKLWNTFGWFFEKDYHNKIPILGFVISSALNIFFSSLPFWCVRFLEEHFLKTLNPRQFAVCVRKSDL